METINRLLVVLGIIAVIALATVTFRLINMLEVVANNVAEKTLSAYLEAYKDKNTISSNQDFLFSNSKDILLTQQHPYNECLKMFVDKAKEAKEFDFEKAKSICFELLHKTKEISDMQGQSQK